MEFIANDFFEKWNYPCCIGALDGKHIAILQFQNSGSEYFNYKHFFSIVLLALVDANYKFVDINVGASVRAGDAGIYTDSDLKKALDENSLNLPKPTSIHGIARKKIHYHIVGDDAYSLSLQMMKPYPHRNMDKAKRIFNYCLSRARRVVENAFGILANRFHLFLTTTDLSPEKVKDLIMAACCLHNFMIEHNKSAYISVCDAEDTHTMTFANGTWRCDPPLAGLQSNLDRNPKLNAKQQRQKLTFSLISESVPWQDGMISL